MLAKAMKLDGEVVELTFTDQDNIGDWAQQVVAQMVRLGVVNGYDDGTFRPNAQMSRAEMAVMIARVLKLSLNENEKSSFADDTSIPAWAKSAVEAIYKNGIANGRGNNYYAPNETATRAEVAVLLLRMLEKE
ncbi:MAG TPA: S-layer homology domain-containing protein [Bacilli bacterium]|nr:S-layer homology domain-containing protein [Bacilli bacterium]